MKISLLLLTILLFGCSKAVTNKAYIPDTSSYDVKTMTTKERAEALSKEITGIKGISEASVFISGNMALVGIGIDGEFDDKDLINYKKEVEELVKARDSGIQRVATTATKELMERITNIDGSGNNNNNETEGTISDEAEEVIGELTPLL